MVGGNYFCFKGIGPERGERGSSFNLISIRSGAGKTAEVDLWLEVRVGTGTPTVPSPAVSVCVGIFPLQLYRLIFPLGGVGRGWGWGWGQGPWVRAKTIRSDRDRARLCEKVFMRVCARRRQGSLAGGFNSKRTCEDGSVKSVCAGVEGGPWARSIKWLL